MVYGLGWVGSPLGPVASSSGPASSFLDSTNSLLLMRFSSLKMGLALLQELVQESLKASWILKFDSLRFLVSWGHREVFLAVELFPVVEGSSHTISSTHKNHVYNLDSSSYAFTDSILICYLLFLLFPRLFLNYFFKFLCVSMER